MDLEFSLIHSTSQGGDQVLLSLPDTFMYPAREGYRFCVLIRQPGTRCVQVVEMQRMILLESRTNHGSDAAFPVLLTGSGSKVPGRRFQDSCFRAM